MADVGTPKRYPVAVYEYLPRDWRLGDPLPSVHTGPVFHYTNLAGNLGLIETGVAWASHVRDLNDPSERLYGWDTIRQRFKARPPATSDYALAQIQEILDYVDQPGDWYPQAFVFSGSTVGDSLTQYRLYGQYQVELAGGVWRASSDVNRLYLDEDTAEWRPVLYGPDKAEPYIDLMLAAAADIIDNIPPESGPEDESMLAMLALEVLALHIKHPAYADEHEVRLVFSAPRGSYANARVRIARDCPVKYLEVRAAGNAEQGFIKGVVLGPLAGGENTAESIRLHHRNHFPVPSSLSHEGLPVSVSQTPYRA